MFIVSSKTTQARKKLEEIKSDEGNGKELLKKFLEGDLKNTFARQTGAQAVIKAAESTDSNIYKFATLLDSGNNMALFKKAIELQAKSLGTNKKGLFNKLILPIKEDWLNSKSKIKAFLLAKKGENIGDDEEEVESEDKASKRMKNSDIVAKLKSKRLSNVLKVFMALVMWDYIKINEKAEKKRQEEAAEKERQHQAQETAERKKREEEAKKAAEAEKKRQEEAAEKERQHQAQEAAERKKREEEKRRKAQEEAEKKKAQDAEAEKKRQKEEKATKAGRLRTGNLTAEDLTGLTLEEKNELTALVIPDGVERVDQRAFLDCKKLETITIPGSVKTIKDGAFCNCTGLKSVTIGNGVESIGFQAFAGCEKLETITIPGNVKTIEEQAFNNCTGLKSVTLENGVESIGVLAFGKCTSLSELKIPKSVKFIGNSAFNDCPITDISGDAEDSIRRKIWVHVHGTIEGYAKTKEEETPAADPNQKGRYADIDRTKKLSNKEFDSLYVRQGIAVTTLQGKSKLISVRSVALDEQFIKSIMERRYAHLQQVQYGIKFYIDKIKNDATKIKDAVIELISEINGELENKTDAKIKTILQNHLSKLENIRDNGVTNMDTLMELYSLINKILEILKSNPEKIPSLKLSDSSIEKLYSILTQSSNAYYGVNIIKGDKKGYDKFMITSDEKTDRYLALLEGFVYDGACLSRNFLEQLCMELTSVPNVYGKLLPIFKIDTYPASKDLPNPYRTTK